MKARLTGRAARYRIMANRVALRQEEFHPRPSFHGSTSWKKKDYWSRLSLSTFVALNPTGACVKKNNVPFVLNITSSCIGGLYDFILIWNFIYLFSPNNLKYGFYLQYVPNSLSAYVQYSMSDYHGDCWVIHRTAILLVSMWVFIVVLVQISSYVSFQYCRLKQKLSFRFSRLSHITFCFIPSSQVLPI